MSLRSYLLLGVILLGVILSVTGCVNPRDIQIASVGADYWAPKMSGFVEADAVGLLGTKIGLDDTLDMGDERVWIYNASLRAGSIALDVSYMKMGYEGDTTLSQTINFNGQSFTATTDVSSDLDLTLIKGDARFGLTGVGPVAVFGIAGVNYIDVEANISAAGQQAKEQIDQYFPVIGAGARFDLPLSDGFGVFADAEISGLSLSLGDLKGTFYDADGRVGVKLGEAFRAGVGYRLIELDLKDDADDSEADFRLAGPFIFGELAF